MSEIRIALADDQVLFRAGLKALLAAQPTIRVVAETDQIDDVLPMLARAACDILLLEICMDASAMTLIPSLAEHSAVIVVTSSDALADGLAALHAGARAVVSKRCGPETLMEALRVVARGEVWIPGSLQAYLASTLRQPEREILTVREREIVRWVACGLRNVEIAHKLFISEQTVKAHLSNIFRKLGIRDRVELALYAARSGVIDVPNEPFRDASGDLTQDPSGNPWN